MYVKNRKSSYSHPGLLSVQSFILFLNYKEYIEKMLHVAVDSIADIFIWVQNSRDGERRSL